MEFGLFVNTYLDNSRKTALGLGKSRPSYPRPRMPLSYLERLKVFRLCLKSMAKIPFTKVLLNVEAHDSYGMTADAFLELAREIFSNATVISGGFRPTTQEGWLESISEATQFFGENTPVLCAQNHDHFFTEYCPNEFMLAVNRAFYGNQSENNYMGFTHFPEVCSFVASPLSYSARLRCWPGAGMKTSNIVQSIDGDTRWIRSGFLASAFITTMRGLHRVWANATVTTNYAPRNEWPGVSSGNLQFNMVVSNREFFRHYDGYGHVTFIPSCLGMCEDDIDLDLYVEKSKVPLLQSISSQSVSAKVPTQEELAAAYVDYFESNYLLAFRDFLFYKSVHSGDSTDVMMFFNKLFDSLRKANIERDSSYWHQGTYELDDVIELTQHAIYSKITQYISICAADCRYIPITALTLRGRASRAKRKARRLGSKILKGSFLWAPLKNFKLLQ